MNFLTLAVGTYFPITVSSSESGDRCAIHRAGHRGVRASHASFLENAEGGAHKFFRFSATRHHSFLDMQALRDFIRT